VLFAIPVLIRARMECLLWLASARVAIQSTGDTESGIEMYRKALSWRSPFDSNAEVASNELFEVGKSSSLEFKVRLKALEALRRGLMASRGLWWLPELSPWRGVTRAQVEAEISRINPPPPVVVKEIVNTEPNYFLQIVAQFCFLAWIALTVRLIFCSFDTAGKLKRPILGPGIGCATLFVLWLMALRFA